MDPKKDQEKEEPTQNTAENSTPQASDSGGEKDVFAEVRERLEMAAEMREIFEEDSVSHQHGSAQPEGD